MLVNCTNCGKEFDKLPCEIKKTKNHFCSRNCSTSYNNRGKVRHSLIERTCKKCKQSYFTTNGHRSKSFCSTCLNGMGNRTEYYKSLTLQELQSAPHLTKKQIHPAWLNAQVRQFNRYWNADLTKKPCHVCGYGKHVELCHKKAIADFPLTATLAEVNHPDNVIQLCPNHHWEFDNGHLTL